MTKYQAYAIENTVTRDELAAWVKKRLIHHHYLVIGEDPTGGAFTPKEETLDKLLTVYRTHGEVELDEFLADSIHAYMHRTRGTNQPFYINTQLLSRPQLEYLETFKSSSHYFAAKSFEDNIRQDLAQTEQDYLQVVLMASTGHSKLVWLDSFAPTPWWLVASELFHRIRRKEFPAWWAESRAIQRGSTVIDFAEEYPKVRRRVNNELRLKVLIESLFKPIVETSMMHFLGSRGLINYTKDSFRRQVIVSSKICGESIQGAGDLCKFATDLSIRDLKVVAELSEHFKPVKTKQTRAAISLRQDDLTEHVRRALIETESA